MLSMIINWVALWHKHHGTWHKQYFMYFLVITIVAFWHKYTLSLVLNGQELNIDDIPVNVSIDVPLVNSEERNEPELELHWHAMQWGVMKWHGTKWNELKWKNWIGMNEMKGKEMEM